VTANEEIDAVKAKADILD